MSVATEQKPHVSATQLSMYWRCPEQYRRRYMEGERVPPGIAMLVGSGFHYGAEFNFAQKVDSYEDLPESDIVEAAVAGFDARTHAESYALTDDEASTGAGKVLGQAQDTVAALTKLHATAQAPDYQPVVVEHRTRIVFPSATHDLLAVTDLRDDKGRIPDLKTSAKKKPANAADRSLQLTIYAAAMMVDTGQMPSEVRLDVVTKTKTPARQVLSSTRNRTDFQSLLNRVNVTLAAINAGSFPPCDPEAWVCSTKWCGFARDCPYYNPERENQK